MTIQSTTTRLLIKGQCIQLSDDISIIDLKSAVGKIGHTTLKEEQNKMKMYNQRGG